MLMTIFNAVYAAAGDVTYSAVNVGFTIPKFDEVLTFLIRLFFVVAGLVALIYLLLGAMAWITSSGNKENVDKAREKIQAALVGLILIFVVLSIIGVMEQILFKENGLGITKPIGFPKLIK